MSSGGAEKNLRGRQNADAVVIGGGLSGVTIALWLLKAGLKVTLLEAETLGFGATSRCQGMVSLTNGLLYARVERLYGLSRLSAYAATQTQAFQALRALAGEPGARGSWRDADAYLLADNARNAAALEKEAAAMNRAGLQARMVPPPHTPLPAVKALLIKDMATINAEGYFHYAVQSARRLGLSLYEHSRVTAIEPGLVFTRGGSVMAPYIIVATGYPIINTPGWYFLKLRQEPRASLSLSGGLPLSGLNIDALGRYAMYAPTGEVMLQMTLDARKPGLHPAARAMRGFVGPSSARPRAAGLTVESPDGLPCIGPYGRKTPNVFVAAAYGGRGLLGSMLAAQAISARILGLPYGAYELYSASREHHAPFVALQGASGIAGRYLRALALRPGAPKCAHLGCRLRYNPDARLWECPCHGSRFDGIGHVLNAPAIRDADIKNGKR